MLRKCNSEIGLTLALLAYHDTPISDALPSPAELMFSRRTCTRLIPTSQQSVLSDTQKSVLTQKRAAHLKPSKDCRDYIPNQPIWFSDDSSDEWKPGYIESKDVHPHSYWIVNDKNNRRIRRNLNDIKPRHPTVRQQQPETWVPTDVDLPWTFEKQKECALDLQDHQSSQQGCTDSSSVPNMLENTSHQTDGHDAHTEDLAKEPSTEVQTKTPTSTRSGRQLKPNKDPNFIYYKWFVYYTILITHRLEVTMPILTIPGWQWRNLIELNHVYVDITVCNWNIFITSHSLLV